MGKKSSAVRDEALASCAGVSRPKPRERIVATARDMFHEYGIRNVGVEAIAEAAGTNKMTLYRHFGSKDELIVECLRGVSDEIAASWQRLESAHPGDAMAQLRAWLREGADCVLTDRRGCTLANAAVELTESDHPARRLIEQCKVAYRDRLVRLCEAAGVARAELLADALSLLLEGARVSRQSVGAEGPSAQFVRLGEAMIAAFHAR